MARRELPVSPNYVATMTVADAIREIVCNAQDAVVMHGATLTIKHFKRGKRLVVTTDGASIDTSKLVFGQTDKADRDDTIGYIGEGLKLALVVLARTGHEIRIYSAGQLWTAAIETSEAYGGVEVLVVYTRRVSKSLAGESVRVEIEGISAKLWEETEDRFLFLKTTDDLSVGRRTAMGTNVDVLFAPERQGKVYVRGVFVQEIENLAHGYDFRAVKTDRDRKMVDSWAARGAMTEALVALAGEDKSVAKTLYLQAKAGREDASGYALTYAMGSSLDALIDCFYEEFGSGAIPCETEAQVKSLEALGGKGGVVPALLRQAIERRTLGAAHHIQSLERSARRFFQHEDLLAEERSNLDLSLEVLAEAGFSGFKLKIAEFSGDLLGIASISDNEIILARKCLSSIKTTVRALVHEVAHLRSKMADGTVHHSLQHEEIWCAVWAKSFGA